MFQLQGRAVNIVVLPWIPLCKWVFRFTGKVLSCNFFKLVYWRVAYPRSSLNIKCFTRAGLSAAASLVRHRFVLAFGWDIFIVAYRILYPVQSNFFSDCIVSARTCFPNLEVTWYCFIEMQCNYTSAFLKANNDVLTVKGERLDVWGGLYAFKTV